MTQENKRCPYEVLGINNKDIDQKTLHQKQGAADGLRELAFFFEVVNGEYQRRIDQESDG